MIQVKLDQIITPGKTSSEPKAEETTALVTVDTTNLNVPIMPLLIVSVDEAHSDSIYGGALAGPVFQKIMKRTMERLQKRELLN